MYGISEDRFGIMLVLWMTTIITFKCGSVGLACFMTSGQKYDLSEWAKLSISSGTNTIFIFKDGVTKTFKNHNSYF